MQTRTLAETCGKGLCPGSRQAMQTWWESVLRKMTRGPEITRRSILLGIGAVGAFLVADLGAVAFANKWIGAGNKLTTQAFLDRFRAVFGSHPGTRRNHAKGVVVTGHFESNGNGTELSRAEVFGAGRTPVIGRFSLSGGNPAMADAPNATRGLGLAFGFPGAS